LNHRKDADGRAIYFSCIIDRVRGARSRTCLDAFYLDHGNSATLHFGLDQIGEIPDRSPLGAAKSGAALSHLAMLLPGFAGAQAGLQLSTR